MMYRLTGSCESLVHGAFIDSVFGLLSVGFWDEPNDWHVGVEFLRSRFDEDHLQWVPSTALHIETTDIAAVHWNVLNLSYVLFHDLKCRIV